MRAKVTWTGPGLRMVGETDGGPAVVLDSTGSFGTHTGLTPMEMVLVGLVGCTGMDVASIMAKMRQPVANLTVQAEAERAEEHPKVFTKVQLHYIAYGKAVEEKALAKAITLSKERYCPVQAMLSGTVEINTSYEVVESANPTRPGEPIAEG